VAQIAGGSHIGSLVPQNFPFSGASNSGGRGAVLQNLLIAALVIAGLYFGRDVLIPLAVAILLSFVLTTPLLFLRRLRIPRVVGVLILVSFTLVVMATLGWRFSQQVGELIDDFPSYRYTIVQKVTALRESLGGMPALEKASDAVEDLERDLKKTDSDSEAPAASPETKAKEKPIPVEVHEPAPADIEIFQSVAGTILPPLATAGIVLIFLIFILLQREELRDRTVRLLAASDVLRATSAMNEAADRLSKYFLSQLLINTAFGAFIALALWFIGIPSPVAWGTLATLMRFVPFIGSYIAAAPPLLLAAAIEPTWSTFLLTGSLYLVSELIMGQVVEPLVYGRGAGLSPLAVLLAAIFWTWIWGPVGLVLAVPLTVCLVVLGKHIEGLQFLDVMLGDEPALTQSQTFYQRVLAGDSAETTYQAEIVLKNKPLKEYLDEVAVKGLQLAEHDRARGLLGDDSLDRINVAVKELMENLAEFEPRRWFRSSRRVKEDPDLEEGGLASLDTVEEETEEPLPVLKPDEVPAGWAETDAILCIGAQTPVDDAASVMLAGLLKKHGLEAQPLDHAAISEGRIFSLEKSVKLIVLSYVSLGPRTAHVRYLVRRLRRILPDAKIVIGYWREHPDPVLEQVKKIAEADGYATSLSEAAEIVIGFVRAEEDDSETDESGKPTKTAPGNKTRRAKSRAESLSTISS
jgi:predicted PurR-regulated permease PerM